MTNEQIVQALVRAREALAQDSPGMALREIIFVIQQLDASKLDPSDGIYLLDQDDGSY